MAARRLIVVLILLLAASVLAASIMPDRTSRIAGVDNDDTSTEETTSTSEETTSTSEDTTAAEEPAEGVEDPAGTLSSGGRALTRRIDASEAKPETVTAAVGDQLSLSVGSDPARTIEIAPLGLTEFAGDDAPARFDLLLRAPGAYPITDAADPAVILGRIRVLAPDEGDREGDERTKGT